MSSQNIQVAVRCRPLNDRERKQNSYSVIECNEKKREIIAFDRNSAVSNTKTFTFDRVFGSDSKQVDVYNQVVKPVVNEVIEGYNCTIFAYGQTGTGKTFTMEGDRPASGEDISWEDDPMVGIVPRSVAQLFSSLKSMPNCEYSVKVSYIELYNEELTDLLSEQPLEKEEKLKIYDDPSRKGSVMISKLEEVIVQNKKQVYNILQKGAERRQKAVTLMNAQSSRSHSIFTVTVFIKEKAIEGEETIKIGKLNLVDLAGSENIERSGATGKRAAEAGKINRSLTTLGRVITALVEHRDHIPYRESNLTRLLQDSLGGKTKTTIIATISPALCNLEETLSTLDYAHKAKSIRNKPEINQKLVKKALIKEYTEEIERLKRELHSTREKNGIYLPFDIYQQMESNTEMHKIEMRESLKKIAVLSDENEKLNEIIKRSQEDLNEKTDTLYQAERNLCQTQNKLETVQIQLDEAKYLIDERLKSEEKVHQQAKSLACLNTEFENDNKNLFNKIERIHLINDNNRELASRFTIYLNSKINQISQDESDINGANRQRLCCLCSILNDIKQKLKQSKEDQLGKIQLFDDKQKNWLNCQQTIIKNEFEANFKDYYEEFMKSLSNQTSNLINNYDYSLEVCNEHKDSFNKLWFKLNQSIESMEKNFVNFETNLGESINKFLVTYLQEYSVQTNKKLDELNHLSESLDEHRKEIGDLLELKHSIKTFVSDTFKCLKETIESLEANINDKFSLFEKKFDKIKEKNEFYFDNLTNLKENMKENDQNMVKKFNNLFDSHVNVPIKSLLETNSKNMIELNILAKSLHEKHDLINSHFSNSIQGFKMIENENSSNMDKMVSTQFSIIDKSCKKIQSSLNSYREESSKYFEKLVNQSIESENTTISKMVDESINLANQTKHSNENMSELNREFYSTSTRALTEFIEQDFQSYQSTGKTPNPKIQQNNFDLCRLKSNDELIEDYRNSRPSDEFKQPCSLPVFSLNSEELSPNMSAQSTVVNNPDSIRSIRSNYDMKSESTQQASKRTFGNDKENVTDNMEKATKMQKYASQSRLYTKKSNQAFQDRN